MSRAAWCLLGLFVAGCSYSVDDAMWTYRWRSEGRQLRFESRRMNQSCDEGAQDRNVLHHLRYARLGACERACAGSTPEAKEACLLGCDATITLVSARCEPASHRETWNPITIPH